MTKKIINLQRNICHLLMQAGKVKKWDVRLEVLPSGEDARLFPRHRGLLLSIRQQQLTCSEQSKCWTHWRQDQSLGLFRGQSQAPISPRPDGREREASEPATLLRASDTLEGGWEHQGEVCNWISVYFGPRLRSVHNEGVIRWLILARALCWDKVSTVPTGKMGACQIARVQPYIIHFYSWSNFPDQVWEGKEHSFVVAWGVGNLGFIHNVLIWIGRKTQY